MKISKLIAMLSDVHSAEGDVDVNFVDASNDCNTYDVTHVTVYNSSKIVDGERIDSVEVTLSDDEMFC